LVDLSSEVNCSWTIVCLTYWTQNDAFLYTCRRGHCVTLQLTYSTLNTQYVRWISPKTVIKIGSFSILPHTVAVEVI